MKEKPYFMTRNARFVISENRKVVSN